MISTEGSKYMFMDAQDFYLNTTMSQYEYLRIQVYMISEEFMIKYNLHLLVHNGYIYVDIRKGIYGLTQDSRISQYQLQKDLTK